MKGQKNQQQDASNFFAQAKENPTAKFQDSLRVLLHEHYLNSYITPKMKTQFPWKWAALACGALVIVLGVVLFATNKLTPQVYKLGATIAYQEGDIEYKSTSGGWNDIAQGMDLTEGQTIRVNGKGKTIVALDDGSALRLNADASITLTSLDPKNVIITNEGGGVYSRVAKADRTFTVVAGTNTYESLGTAYKTVNLKDRNGVEVYESKVKVDGKIEVDQGYKYYDKFDPDKSHEKKVEKINQDLLKQDQFILWNKEEDKKDYADELGILKNIDTTPQVTETPVVTPTKTDSGSVDKPTDTTPGIYASGYTGDNGVVIKWSLKNMDTVYGVKIVWNMEGNPTYPGSSYNYVSNPSQRQYTVGLKDGKTYHFRVCRYTGSGCDIYSNDFTVKAPLVATPTPTPVSSVSSITLTAGSNGYVSWSVNGYSSLGFKVVWSKTTGPTYPGSNYHYYENPAKNSDTVTAVEGSGTYYVRVCQYLGGYCGVYSNEVTVTLP